MAQDITELGKRATANLLCTIQHKQEYEGEIAVNIKKKRREKKGREGRKERKRRSRSVVSPLAGHPSHEGKK